MLAKNPNSWWLHWEDPQIYTCNVISCLHALYNVSTISILLIYNHIVMYIPYPLEYSPTLEYNLTPFQKSCFWAFSWIDPHFLVKKSPFCGIFWIEPHPKTHIEKYNPVVILERIRYFVLRSPDFSQFILGASMFDFNTSIIAEWTLKYVVFKKNQPT